LNAVRSRGALLLAALALAVGCDQAARGLGGGPAGGAAATTLVDALRARYGRIAREPSLQKARPKIEAAVLVPSRVFDDRSIWTASEGNGRSLSVEGRGAPGAYRLGLRATSALPRAPGEYRARIALRRQESGGFEWDTFDELALGPLRPAELSAAFRALLQAAEQRRGDARAQVVGAMPRSARALGRLFDLEALSLSPAPDGTQRIEIAVRQRPERLKAEAPKLAAYLERRARGTQITATVALPDGRPLWAADGTDGAWRIRLRARGGRLVPLQGPPAGGPLHLALDYSIKAGLFRVGVRGLKADIDTAPAGETLALAVRFVQEPEWRIPFLIKPFMRASLRYPFEQPGARVRVAVREEPGRGSLLVSDSRLQVKESWIVRWFGGLSEKAMAELRAADEEADRYALECLTAARDDLADLLGSPP
jgi:hypothetical protein